MHSLLLCIVLSVLAAAAAQHDCDKVTNATVCVTDNLNQTDSLNALLKFTHSPFVPVASSSGNEFKWCKRLIVNVCFFMEFEPWGEFLDNVTIGITVANVPVWSFETTIPNLFVENGICIDDNTVLEILLLIPSLRNDTQTILDILEVTGCEPRGLFSMCLFWEPCGAVAPTTTTGAVVVADQSAGAADRCGCFSFDFQLLYLRKWCVVHEVEPLGCIGQSQDGRLYLADPNGDAVLERV